MSPLSWSAIPFKILAGAALILFVVAGAIKLASANPVKHHPIHKFLSVEIGIETVFPEGDRFTMWPDFPSLHGRMRAVHDLDRGEAKFYFYGLISGIGGDNISDALYKYQLKAEFGGCLTGTPGYQADMAYNGMIEKRRNISVLEILNNARVKTDRRGNPINENHRLLGRRPSIL